MGSERICVRSTQRLPFERQKEEKKPITLKGNFADVIREEHRNRERIPIKNEDEEEKQANFKDLMKNNERMFFYE